MAIEGILRSIRSKELFFQKAIQNKKKTEWERYKHYRYILTRAIEAAKILHNERILTQRQNIPKTQWKIINEIIGKKEKNKRKIKCVKKGEQLIVDDKQIANSFNE